MSKNPPKAYRDFVTAYPRLEESWDKAREQESDGPLDDKSRRLVKLGIAVGAMRRGAVSSAARKARAAGASEDEIRQVVALAASTLGFPSTVAVFSWINEA
jgi:alkylhydroperoxidase/carboxymuconolactone decarboxylase family protein YurZ